MAGEINLGNVVGLLLSQTPPTKKYILWGHVINPVTLIGTIIKIYDWDTDTWIPLQGSGGGGTTIWKGPFNDNAAYVLNDAVSYQNEIWQNIVPIPSGTGNPFNPAQWTLIGTTKASNLDYDIVGDNSDWDGGTAPPKQNLANDQLASRVKVLEGSTPVIEYTFELYANNNAPTSNIFPLYGPVLLFGTERKNTDVLSISYETQISGSSTWIPHADFTALDTYLTSNTGLGTFFYVRGILTANSPFEGEMAVALDYTKQ